MQTFVDDSRWSAPLRGPAVRVRPAAMVPQPLAGWRDDGETSVTTDEFRHGNEHVMNRSGPAPRGTGGRRPSVRAVRTIRME